MSINAKLLLKGLWKNYLDWDGIISWGQIGYWKNMQKDLQLVSNVNSPRFTANDQCQLLSFSKTLGKAFETTIYLRCIKENQVSTNLIYSKSIITPSKELSLPRIELLTVLFGARSLNFWKKVFSWKIKEMIFWTDSRFLLKKILSSFIQGRVAEIKSNSNMISCVISGMWQLMIILEILHEGEWVQMNDKMQVMVAWTKLIEPRQRKVLWKSQESKGEESSNHNKLVENSPKVPFEIMVKSFSSLCKLLQITTSANRYMKNCRTRQKITGMLTLSEMTEAYTLSSQIRNRSWIPQERTFFRNII